MKVEVKILKQYHSNLWPEARAGDTRIMEDYQLTQLIGDIGSTYVRVERMIPDGNEQGQEAEPEAGDSAGEKRPRRGRKAKSAPE